MRIERALQAAPVWVNAVLATTLHVSSHRQQMQFLRDSICCGYGFGVILPFYCNQQNPTRSTDRMIIVEIRDGETLDKALRRYKKKFERLGILKEVRSRMYYTPPSISKREVVKRAIRRVEYQAGLEQ